ncbi:MAG: DUF1634 domain-containing protein [Phycisphaerae bacterium]
MTEPNPDIPAAQEPSPMAAHTPPADDNGEAPITNETVIQDVSAWILRIGSFGSVSILLLGLVLAMVQHPLDKKEMLKAHFSLSLSHVSQGLMHARGLDVMEIGIFLLVLTPVMRVAASVILFAFVDRDKVYTVVTLIVLLITLASLFLLR